MVAVDNIFISHLLIRVKLLEFLICVEIEKKTCMIFKIYEIYQKYTFSKNKSQSTLFGTSFGENLLCVAPSK
jgi:hypothetical protein